MGIGSLTIKIALVLFTVSWILTEDLNAKSLYLKSMTSSVDVIENAKLSQEQTNYYIVQFKQSLSAEDRKALESFGAKFESYIPEDAILAKMSPSQAKSVVKAIAGVDRVVPYVSDLKLSPDLRPSIFNWKKPVSLVVRTLNEEVSLSIQKDLSSNTQNNVEAVDGRMIFVATKYSEINSIAKMDGIEWIEEVPEFQNAMLDLMGSEDDPVPKGDYTDLTGFESGTHIMNFQSAYNRGLTGQGQVAAMADTGLDSGNLGAIHPDFGNVSAAYAVALYSDTWADPQGHGTHVAGSVIGTGVASGGLIHGGAIGANFVAQGMWSKMMNNLMVPTKLGKMFLQTYNDGARIHTNSWGTPRGLGSYDNFAAQVDQFMWEHPDMLVLFAAGNSGEDANKDGRIDEGSVCSPGTAKNVLTVGASENFVSVGGIQRTLSELRDGANKWGVSPLAEDKLSDNPNGLAAFSSRGPTNDGRIKPEIVAPGTNILSTRSSVPGASVLWGAYNDKYVYAGGTSMATPLTAGAATIMRQYLNVFQNIDTPSAALIKAGMVHTATDLFPGQYGVGPTQELPTRRPNVHEGYGLVNLDNLNLLDSGLIHDNNTGLAEKESMDYDFTLVRDGVFLATMAYTDSPAAASATRTLVNDLDLEIVQNNEVVFTQNDSTNNLEMIEGQLKKGVYKLRVSAKRVVNGKAGKQPYALIISTY